MTHQTISHPRCRCGGSGVIDSGGVTPWQSPVQIGCPDCARREALSKALPLWHFEPYGIGSYIACFPPHGVGVCREAWDQLSAVAFIAGVCGPFYAVKNLKPL